MSVNRWRGDALPQAQTETFTVGSSTAGQTFGVTINGKTLSYTAVSGDTVATIANGLQAVLSASTTPAEFSEVTWTSDGVSVVTATAATPGVPFVTAVAGTGTLTKATVTTSSGPGHADAAANWSLGALPAAGDDVLIDGGSDLLYGLQNLPAVAYNSLRVKASFTGQIGLAVWHSSGGGFTSSGSGYYEYRTRQWSLHTAVPVTIGEGDGAGPKLVNLAVASALSLVVLKTGTRQAGGGTTTGNVPVVNVSGCSSGTVSIAAGDVGLAADDDSLSATVATAAMTGGTLTVGPGAAVTTLNQDAGTVGAYGAVSTLVIDGGTYTQYDGSLTTVTANGGTVDYRIGGTITTATFQGQGGAQNVPTLECGNDPRAKTITSGTFTGGAVLHDPYKTTTWTNPQTWDAASLAASDLGPRFTLTRT